MTDLAATTIEPSTATEPLYLYAVVEGACVGTRRWRAACDAVEGLHAICSGDLAAAVSPVPEVFERLAAVADDPGPPLGQPSPLQPGEVLQAAAEDAARVHERSVEHLFDCGPLLPVRLGCVLRSPEDVVRLLERESVAMRRQLAQLGARREWTLKVRWHGWSAALDATGAERGAAGPVVGGPGTAYLAGRRLRRDAADRLQRLCEERGRAVEEFLGALVPVVGHIGRPGSVETEARARSAPIEIFNGSLLLDPGEEAAFFDGLDEALSRGDALTAECSGPWPPYAFVSISSGDT